MTAQNDKSKSAQKSAPAYEKFVAEMRKALDEAGVPYETWELRNFVGFKSTVNEQKWYVPKHAGGVTYLHTTIECPLVPGKILATNPNGSALPGKVERWIAPDLGLFMEHVAPLATASESRLRANRRPARKTGSQETVEVPEGCVFGDSLEEMLGTQE